METKEEDPTKASIPAFPNRERASFGEPPIPQGEELELLLVFLVKVFEVIPIDQDYHYNCKSCKVIKELHHVFVWSHIFQ